MLLSFEFFCSHRYFIDHLPDKEAEPLGPVSGCTDPPYVCEVDSSGSWILSQCMT